MITEEKVVYIPELNNMFFGDRELYHKVDMTFTKEESDELNRRGLMDIYIHYGKVEAVVLRSRVFSVISQYALELGLPLYSQEIVDRVTIKWVEDLRAGKISSIVRILEKTLLIM